MNASPWIVFCFCSIAVGADAITVFPDYGDPRAVTIQASHGRCRDHSLLYAEALRTRILWAVEMYDASAKSGSGILYGSTYDFGNFDQCLEIRVPLKQDEFFGKYCLAKFVINSPENVTKNLNFDVDDYRQIHNVSVWEKIEAFRDKDNKNTRNELYHAFCIPSSCTYQDLRESLEKTIKHAYNGNRSFNIDVSVNEIHCQTQEDDYGAKYSAGDIAFLVFLGLLVLTVAIATCYDLIVRRIGDFRDYRLKGKLNDLIMCFSFPHNLKKLATKTSNEDGLDAIAGVKVISMFCIILGHRCMFYFGSPMANPPFIENQYKKWDATFLLNGPIIVDTFLVISGFLASYLIILKIDQLRTAAHFGMLYLHRIIRLVPVYAVVIAFYCTLFVKIGSGPLWQERVGTEQARCQRNWWLNLLFVNNYVRTDEICMFQSWYLDCEIHFYLLTPPLIWLICKKPLLGLSTTVLLILSSTVFAFINVYTNKADGILLLFTKLLKDPVLNKTFREVYIPSHMRISPYFIGILGGYAKYKMKIHGIKLSKYTVIFSWMIGTFIALATLFTGFVFYDPQVRRDAVFSAFYGSMHHVTWSVCMAFVVVAMSTGHGAWVEPLLLWQPFILLSRITYTAFVCHGAIQIYTAATIRQPIYTSVFNTFYMAAADIFYAYLIGFILTMYVEAPIIGLEKLIFRKSFKKREPRSSDGSLTTSTDLGNDNRAFESNLGLYNQSDTKRCEKT